MKRYQLLVAAATLAALPLQAQNVIREVPRLTVVEEYTGTGCGWCIRGWEGMEMVKNERAGKACVIAWHKYNANDPMYQDVYASINFGGAPSCAIDRKKVTDPYNGDNYDGILAAVDQVNQDLATVDIQIEARYTDDDMTQVAITASTEFLTDAEGYGIAYALTADNLSGTTRAWSQANYYARNDASYVDNDPILSKYCADGESGRTQVLVTFNDALISSSYAAEQKPAALGKHSAGEKENTEFTLPMPDAETHAELMSHLYKDQVYATVFVTDTRGQIANAARVRVLRQGEDAVLAPSAVATDSRTYDLQGRRSSGAAHGLLIRGGKKFVK